MKFVCSNCKAKYQIADEKIQGRTLKMDCRRCNTSITIRGDLPQQADEMELDDAEARPASVRPPAGSQGRKPAGATPGASMGGSSVGAHPSRPRPGASPASMASPSGHGSMGHASMGHSSPSAASHSALGADFRRGSSIAPEARPVESRTSVLDQWHVAINDVPVGPMRREEVSRKIATGAVTQDSLAWREGFDDWRPVRDIPELAALLRKAEPVPSRGMPAPRPGANTSASSRLAAASPSRLGGGRGSAPLTTQGPGAAAARGNVVPIGGRLGGAAPQLEDEEGLDEGQDEPTQIASAADLGLLAFGDANALKGGDLKPKAPEKAKPVDKIEAKAPAPAPRKDPTGPTRAAPPAGGFPAPKAKEAPKAAEPVKPAPVAAPVAARSAQPLLDDDGLPPLVAPAPLVTPDAAPPAALAAPSVTTSQTFAPAPSVAAAQEAAPRRRGLPVGAWMGIAGAVAFGAVFAFVAAQRMLPPTPAAPTAVAAVTPPVAPAEPEPPAVELDLPVETPPVVEETAPAAPEATAGTHHPSTDHPAGTGTSRPAGTGTGAPSGTSAADEAARRALLERLGGDTSGGPATIGGAATRRDLRDTETAGTGELTAEQISHVVTRERAGLTRCWETAIRGMRETPTVRMDVDLTIGSSGTVSSTTARGPTVGTLSDCIERSVRRWRFPASGGTSRTSFPVVFSGTN